MTSVLVVGAGPAGLAAAATAAESGCRVQVIDENPAIGGQLWRGADARMPAKSPHGRAFSHWSRRLAASGLQVLAGSTVVANPAPGALRVERAGRWADLSYDRLILCTGARERFLPFPGWTLPGVAGAGGLQALVKCGLPIAGRRVVLSGSGPLLLAVAASLTQAGARIEGVFEQASWPSLARFGAALTAHPGKLMEAARYRLRFGSASYRPGWWIKRALGRERLEAVVATDGHVEREIACDYLGCGFHLVPNIELAQLMGCRIDHGRVVVNDAQRTSIEGIYCAGEPTGIGGLDKALLEGEIAGLAAAGRTEQAARLAPRMHALRRFAERLEATFAPRAELRLLAAPDTIVCRCEDVTRAALEPCMSGRAARLHTRCGMGPCQGRICGPATDFLFGWTAAGPRPPLYPARIATLAANHESNEPAFQPVESVP